MKMIPLTAALVLSSGLALADTWSPLIEAPRAPEVIASEDPIILDIRSPKAYAAGHVEGAVNVPYAAWRGPETNPGALISEDKLSLILSEAGVEPDVPVLVTYQGAGTLDFGSAARVYWTLKSAGVERIAILNGGVNAWTAAGHDLDTEEGSNFPSDLTFGFDPAVQATRQAVAKILTGANAATLLDARPAAFLTGEKRHKAAANAGTFNGAVNVIHEVWFDGPRLSVSPEQVRLTLAAKGIDTTRPIVSFCNTGHWAATNWFVLSEIAGIEGVTLYPESWVGWTRAKGELAQRK